MTTDRSGLHSYVLTWLICCYYKGCFLLLFVQGAMDSFIENKGGVCYNGTNNSITINAEGTNGI